MVMTLQQNLRPGLEPRNLNDAQHALACFFVCNPAHVINYGGSGEAASRLAGFVWAGSSNLAWVATPYGDWNLWWWPLTKRSIAMYTFKFAAICRTDRKNHIHHFSTIADTEQAARRQLTGKFVLFFCARLPVIGGAA